MKNKAAYPTAETGTDILSGLRREQKTIPSKYFYDLRGSQLFEDICRTEEYYLTRTELRIMKENIDEISKVLGRNILLIEFGSGGSLKTRLLIEGADVTFYIPIDISYEHLAGTGHNLKKLFPSLLIIPLHADYSNTFEIPGIHLPGSRRIIYFPGSSIGNFTPPEAEAFLERSALLAGNKGGMLIGFDLAKEKAIIEYAYNDSKGITAAFNLNILNNINRITGADFKVKNFSHLAFYNEIESRVEMHLLSRKDQVVSMSGEEIRISKGETILTEYSYKYRLRDFEELAGGKFDIKKVWIDNKGFFAVCYMETVS